MGRGTAAGPGLQRGRGTGSRSLGKQAVKQSCSHHPYLRGCSPNPARGCEKTTDVLHLFLSFALVSDKLYQRKEPVISSVHTKVKGIAEVTENITEGGEMKSLRNIFDTADYTFPLQVSTR